MINYIYMRRDDPGPQDPCLQSLAQVMAKTQEPDFAKLCAHLDFIPLDRVKQT